MAGLVACRDFVRHLSQLRHGVGAAAAAYARSGGSQSAEPAQLSPGESAFVATFVPGSTPGGSFSTVDKGPATTCFRNVAENMRGPMPLGGDGEATHEVAIAA